MSKIRRARKTCELEFRVEGGDQDVVANVLKLPTLVELVFEPVAETCFCVSAKTGPQCVDFVESGSLRGCAGGTGA
eukprot:1962353-Rhodomonas_salina.7